MLSKYMLCYFLLYNPYCFHLGNISFCLKRKDEEMYVLLQPVYYNLILFVAVQCQVKT